jgi:hypothetical protein
VCVPQCNTLWSISLGLYMVIDFSLANK